MASLNPLLLGLIAGITVYIGAFVSVFLIKSHERHRIGFLNALAGGILAYLAYEATLTAEEALKPLLSFETLGEYTFGLVLTSLGLWGTWLLLAGMERKMKKSNKFQDFTSPSKINSLIAGSVIAVALGVHNIAEGFAISTSLIEERLALALLFTIGFAVHNATEGFAIMAPIIRADIEKSTLRKIIIILPAIAGFPTILGAAVYYVGGMGDITIAFLSTIAAASIVYAMIKVNLSAAADLGGFNEKFWTGLFLGTALTYALESVLVLSFL